MGVYHRYLTPTQTEADIEMQLKSLEIWGKAAQNVYQSDIPKVKAYVGKIPPGKAGIEFTTDVPPDPNTPPHLATWSGDREGVRTEGGYAKLRVLTITRRP
ncbi:MAG: hypothetical protein QNJ72_40335 [Pleurocapsa sp. MO_226.B13]|nr:hypothetical protein [Pleurocapsa sp. MO_226.B13]